MKKIELLVMKLRNFKGIKEKDIHLNGNNAEIFGDNAKGKTTVFDALMWVFFDKDSANKKDFGIQTLVNGEVVHNLEHSVEVILSIDGTTTKLKKVLYEVWKKKRKEPEETLEKTTTDYYINDAPIKTQREYKQFIESIVDEETFKMITSPTHFAQMEWKKQRARLFEVAGTVTDEEVINSNPALLTLPAIIENRTVEQTKEMIEKQLREYKKEQDLLPKLINENLAMKPELTIDVSALEVKVQALEKEIDELKTQRHNVLNGAAVLEKQKQLQELDIELSKLKQSFESESMQEVFKLQARLQEAQGNMQIVQSENNHKEAFKKSKESELYQLSNDIQQIENSLVQLRNEWNQHNAMQFEYEDKCECPSCKQSLPADQVEAARADAQAQFNERKTSLLKDVNTRGKALAQQKAQKEERHNVVNNDLFNINTELDAVRSKLEVTQKEHAKFTEKLKQAQSTIPDVTKSEGYQSIMTQKQSLLNEIQQLNEHANEAVASIDASIGQLNQEKQQVNAELAQVANVSIIDKRVKELEEKQLRYAKECETLEKNLDIIDTFIRTKVMLLDELINSKFKHARFKLHKDLKNGSLEECCEILYDGVPYSQGLNNAARINVGLDIINTLSAHYGVLAPIFIDNAEAVTQLIESGSQLIALRVSEKDKQLRVEVEGQQPMLKEAI